MRILALTGRYPAPSETFLQRDLLALAARGHDLAVVPVESDAGWPVLTLASEPHSSILDSSDRPSLLTAARAFLNCDWLSVRHAARLQDLCARLPWRPDRIWALFATRPAVVAVALGDLLGVPVGVSVHARDVYVPARGGRRALRRAAGILACHQDAATHVRALLPTAHPPIRVIRHGIPDPWLAAPHEQGWAGGSGSPGRTILMIGRFVEKKGFLQGIDAVTTLWEQDPEATADTCLELIGSGPLESAIRQKIAQWVAQNAVSAERIRLVGWQPADSVRERIQQAACLLVPSVVARDGDRDGIPTVVLEAMALGTPVVGTGVGGLADVVSERTGWPATDPGPDLVRAIRSGLVDPQRHERAATAREMIREQHAAASTAEQRESWLGELSLATSPPFSPVD